MCGAGRMAIVVASVVTEQVADTCLSFAVLEARADNLCVCRVGSLAEHRHHGEGDEELPMTRGTN